MDTLQVPTTQGRWSVTIEEWGQDLKRKPHVVAPIVFLLVAIMYLAYAVMAGGNVWAQLISARPSQLVQDWAPFALLALGSGLVIATGQIDLSSTAVAAFSGVVFALGIKFGHGWTPSVLYAVAVGLSAGLVNGFLVAHLSAPALIVTWSTALVFTACATIITQALAGSISSVSLDGAADGAFASLSSPGVASFVGVLILITYFCGTSNLSREAMAVGTDSQSATYIGLSHRGVTFKSFALSGVFAALAGVLQTISMGSAATTELQASGLEVVAICVLGGTLLSGGYFSAVSILFAAAVWSFLKLFIPMAEFPALFGEIEGQLVPVVFSLMVLGVVIVFARKLSGPYHPVLMSFETDK